MRVNKICFSMLHKNFPYYVPSLIYFDQIFIHAVKVYDLLIETMYNSPSGCIISVSINKILLCHKVFTINIL